MLTYQSCSIPCLKIHKATHTEVDARPIPLPQEPMPTSNNGAPRAGTVAAASFKGPFAALDASEDLQILFRTYPRLSAQLHMIDSATHRPVNQNGGYQNNGKGRKEPAWTTDIGMQKGVDAMYRAKSAEDGEGVREYCKLILQILSGDDMAAEEMIQKEIAEENVRMIKGLLDQEQG